ncbi:hypothetical protein VTJ83DRAFT_820 [Remersonia thermophila]|uniref:Elongation of fatty acids protein n=1 Tax=Remersonia thermophila TaxID=72144 RepID=A0ABR4DM91_9PEZI
MSPQTDARMWETATSALLLPKADMFRLPPNPNSGFVPPPPPGSMPSAPPIHIPDHVYYAALDPRVPLTIATVYAVTVKLLNLYNKSTGKKPWAISKTRPFHWFVIAHNIFLAVYSAWTFVGMYGTLKRSIVSARGPQGVAGWLDSMCRINGPAGLGNAAFYNDDLDAWQTYSSEEGVLDAAGVPSRFAPGRMWNEGLAFYGWLFYLSKFYEVFDTLIILAKGKLSSTLQTYHHAGAMLCMWAGIRYMSVPIWLFVFANSFIHSLMYTYYTLTAFKIRVPTSIKRTLTSMQITQFIAGASAATVHSFIYYIVPVISSSSTDEETAATASSAANGTSVPAGSAAGHLTVERHVMPCLTSSGETFAVWLNILYLTPLTYLFVSFFIESYLRRSNAAQAPGKKAAAGTAARRLSNTVQLAEKAGREAAGKVEREVYGESSEEAVVVEEAVPSGKRVNGRTLRSRK